MNEVSHVRKCILHFWIARCYATGERVRDTLQIQGRNVSLKIRAGVRISHGAREICRVRYASWENEGNATRCCVKSTNCYTTARLDAGRCKASRLRNALRSNLIPAITLHWTRAKFKNPSSAKSSLKVLLARMRARARHVLLLPLIIFAGMEMSTLKLLALVMRLW